MSVIPFYRSFQVKYWDFVDDDASKQASQMHQHSDSQLSSLKSIKLPHGIYTNFEIPSRLDKLLFIIFSIQLYAFVIETLFESFSFKPQYLFICLLNCPIKCLQPFIFLFCIRSFRIILILKYEGAGERETKISYENKSYRKIIHSFERKKNLKQKMRDERKWKGRKCRDDFI